jgi:hypothetical protein
MLLGSAGGVVGTAVVEGGAVVVGAMVVVFGATVVGGGVVVVGATVGVGAIVVVGATDVVMGATVVVVGATVVVVGAAVVVVGATVVVVGATVKPLHVIGTPSQLLHVSAPCGAVCNIQSKHAKTQSTKCCTNGGHVPVAGDTKSDWWRVQIECSRCRCTG